MEDLVVPPFLQTLVRTQCKEEDGKDETKRRMDREG